MSIQCIGITLCAPPAPSGAMCRNAGATYQIRSTSRITRMKMATFASSPLRFLRSADSSSANGRKK